MVCTTEGLIDNSPMPFRNSVLVNKPSARKPLHQFSELFDVIQKNSVYGLGASKSKQKSTITVHILWSRIPKR